MLKYTPCQLLTFAGSALCGWSVVLDPSLDPPGWLPLLATTSLVTLATLLTEETHEAFDGASVLGTATGLCCGRFLWPAVDPIAGSYDLYVLAAAIVAVLVTSMLTGVAARFVVLPLSRRRGMGPLLVLCTERPHRSCAHTASRRVQGCSQSASSSDKICSPLACRGTDPQRIRRPS